MKKVPSKSIVTGASQIWPLPYVRIGTMVPQQTNQLKIYHRGCIDTCAISVFKNNSRYFEKSFLEHAPCI